jgi:hypothetical protein
MSAPWMSATVLTIKRSIVGGVMPEAAINYWSASETSHISPGRTPRANLQYRSLQTVCSIEIPVLELNQWSSYFQMRVSTTRSLLHWNHPFDELHFALPFCTG